MVMDQAPMEEEIVGFRFHPTSDELVNHHLKRKLQKIDEKRCVIPVGNIYDHDPPDLCSVYNERTSYKRSSSCSDSFFFCPHNNTNPNSTRNRGKTRGRYWKKTGQEKDVMDEKTRKTIGTKTIPVFCSGRQGNAQEMDLAMHEYHLNADSAGTTIDNPVKYSPAFKFQFNCPFRCLEFSHPDLDSFFFSFLHHCLGMAFSLCHVKKKRRSKMGSNSKRQGSRKGNPPPSGDVESSFHGEALAESQIPQTELLSFGGSDIPAGARCENEGTASSSVHAREDGLSLSDLESDLDLDVDELNKGWIL